MIFLYPSSAPVPALVAAGAARDAGVPLHARHGVRRPDSRARRLAAATRAHGVLRGAPAPGEVAAGAPAALAPAAVDATRLRAAPLAPTLLAAPSPPRVGGWGLREAAGGGTGAARALRAGSWCPDADSDAPRSRHVYIERVPCSSDFFVS